jgi:membrane associated rhomboid family serine protease
MIRAVFVEATRLPPQNKMRTYRSATACARAMAARSHIVRWPQSTLARISHQKQRPIAECFHTSWARACHMPVRGLRTSPVKNAVPDVGAPKSRSLLPLYGLIGANVAVYATVHDKVPSDREWRRWFYENMALSNLSFETNRWVLLTSMFTHLDGWHLAFNMVGLYGCVVTC